MLDVLRNQRHRQLGRLRQERRCGEMNDRTNRAIVGRLIRRVLRGRRLRRRRAPSGSNRGRCLAKNAVEVDVAERQRELHGQREQRQQGAEPLLRSKPSHQENPHMMHSQPLSAYAGSEVTQEKNRCARAPKFYFEMRRVRWGTVNIWGTSDIMPPSRRACARAVPPWGRSRQAGRISPAWPSPPAGILGRGSHRPYRRQSRRAPTMSASP
jgi:hypothetical protein